MRSAGRLGKHGTAVTSVVKRRAWVIGKYFSGQVRPWPVFARGKATAHLNSVPDTPSQPSSPAVSSPSTSFDDDFNIPEIKRSRWCSLSVRRGHPSFKSCEGYLWCTTSSNRSRFRCRSTHWYQSAIPPYSAMSGFLPPSL